MSEDKSFTTTRKCNHCSNSAPMEIVKQYSQLQEYGGVTEPPWEEGDVYELYRCPACSDVTLAKYYWHERYMDGDWQVDVQVLYPADHHTPAGLPSKIAQAYEAALRVRVVDPNAYGVLVGRVLEFVCLDRGAEGKFLGNKLDDLSAKGEIPEKLVDVANGLKDLRNVAAHAALGELTSAELPILDQLTRAILEYVYSAPHLAQKAVERLKELEAAREEKRGSDG